jgi:hypothetical protein
MGGELHQGIVAFEPLSPGREAVMLGRVQVGEIGPTLHPLGRFPVCWKIDLPQATSRAWQPADDVDDAHRKVLDKINDWLNAADLRPAGGA